MEISDRRLSAAVAGLLHDVGKLEQRARAEPWKAAPGMEDMGGPVHATWTAYFAEQYVPESYRAAARHAAYHHQPDRSPAQDRWLSELVALADKLSAGERADQPEKPAQRPPKQLVSIFDRVALSGEARTSDWNYLPLKPLALARDHIFPIGELPDAEESAAYDALCDVLREAARRDPGDGEAYLEGLQAAMQRVAWCVPSAYYHSIPDVSLYDHSRMTAALAVCLAERSEDEIRDLLTAVTALFREKASPEQAALLEQPVALLVGGDFSGLQGFIYSISSKRAAQTLRGRSFYLQLLNEAVLRFVLRRLGLPYTNVIYSGSGHFFMLAPTDAAAQLSAIQAEVTRKVLAHHDTELYVALAAAPLPASGLRMGAFPAHWGAMHAALGRAKQRRFVELGERMHAQVFEVAQSGGNSAGTCSVCGNDRRQAHVFNDEQEEQARICTFCESFAEQLGRKLPVTRFVVLSLGDAVTDGPRATAADTLAAFGLGVQLVADDEPLNNVAGARRAVVWALDDPGEVRWPTMEGLPTARWLHYSVNLVPPMTFDKLQERVEGGFHRLGVLRMDLDSLGEVFVRGLGERATLARVATLSFQISLFFEGWVKRLCERYEDLIYAVYAGGDDVFLIGPWDRMPLLATDIVKALAEFTGDHPDIHLSGGLAFIGGKYPVYQAADDAGEALEQAKACTGKNAFAYLGEAWQWDAFAQVWAKQERIRNLVRSADAPEAGLGGPQAVVQVLRRLARDEADEAHRLNGRPVWGPWMWRGAYLLTRMADRYKSRPELADEIRGIRDSLSENEYRDINQWGAAARWTQLLER